MMRKNFLTIFLFISIDLTIQWDNCPRIYDQTWRKSLMKILFMCPNILNILFLNLNTEKIIL